MYISFKQAVSLMSVAFLAFGADAQVLPTPNQANVCLNILFPSGVPMNTDKSVNVNEVEKLMLAAYCSEDEIKQSAARSLAGSFGKSNPFSKIGGSIDGQGKENSEERHAVCKKNTAQNQEFSFNENSRSFIADNLPSIIAACGKYDEQNSTFYSRVNPVGIDQFNVTVRYNKTVDVMPNSVPVSIKTSDATCKGQATSFSLEASQTKILSCNLKPGANQAEIIVRSAAAVQPFVSYVQRRIKVERKRNPTKDSYDPQLGNRGPLPLTLNVGGRGKVQVEVSADVTAHRPSGSTAQAGATLKIIHSNDTTEVCKTAEKNERWTTGADGGDGNDMHVNMTCNESVESSDGLITIVVTPDHDPGVKDGASPYHTKGDSTVINSVTLTPIALH
jgi:hypothetical protein